LYKILDWLENISRCDDEHPLPMARQLQVGLLEQQPDEVFGTFRCATSEISH
jgi:hypothetical protein